MMKKMIKRLSLCILLVLCLAGCSVRHTPMPIDETNKIDRLFDIALEKTGFNLSDIVSVAYQSPDYSKYQFDMASEMSDAGYDIVSDTADEYVISFGTYYGKAVSVIFNNDMSVARTVNVNYSSIDKDYCPRFDAKSALNKAIEYLDVNQNDVWIVQMTINGSMWTIETASTNADTSLGFDWNDTLLLKSDTGEIIST